MAHHHVDFVQMNSKPALYDAAGLLAACPDAVLAVDLDGTLVPGDMLRRGLVQLLWRAPWSSVLLAAALAQGGRPGLKRAVAQRAPFDPAGLRYNAAVLALIRLWRAAGRRVVLATAAEDGTARAIAGHLELFDEVHASTLGNNLKGRDKAAFLSKRYGAQGFVYVGDGAADLHVWAKAAGAVLVTESPKLHAQVRKMGIPMLRLTSTDGA
ncbi:MAG: Phosphoserine phosphatase [Roseibaca calidilacus]|uniref:Phosphoserine phosphatase n=1 Tax=Roseibaca calidilacus TaxID=1666912 RepID=A0A0P7VWS2_9RHOB|nr:haloacid dehalogenase-like hydrolase [Roseibaca calidilacus]KPP91599.1 MAG: Phosphoserine phosphatase [Roseibaca calidilacus]CUX82846.1 Phosphoserine phosphatase [Roseibaca calidilacus]